MNYVFDIDGTLTPSRGMMNPDFKRWFVDWCLDNPVYLITGSDYAKTLEQVGPEVTHGARAVYNCAGNAIYVQGQLIYRNDFKISQQLRKFLNDLLDANAYPIRTGQHIEERIGLCNFSIVGRGADRDQRKHYIEYDHRTADREVIAREINQRFPEVEATAGGETGVDIYQKGRDKSQVANVLHPFLFFGDRTEPGGNDHTISLCAYKSFTVADWPDTFDILRQLKNSSKNLDLLYKVK